MSDVERLLGWFKDGSLLRPSADTPTTVHLSRAMASLSGAPIELDETSASLAQAIGPAEHYVFILADGLGMNLIESMPETSYLRSHTAKEISSVFPSATAPAITSLATGVWPGEHGVLGWFLYLQEREIQAIALPFVERFTGRPLDELGVQERDIVAGSPLLQDYGRAAMMLMPNAIQDSAYTNRISGGVNIHGYEELDGAIETLMQRIDTASGPTYTYCYYSHVDSQSHVYGPGSDAVRTEVEILNQAVRRLSRALGRDARIVLTADHGLYDVADHQKVVLDPSDDLMALLSAPPAGEPRVPVFHVLAGRAAEFADRFRERYGEHFALLAVDEVDELGLLGPAPLSARARLRFGDFMAISGAGEALVYQPDQGIFDMLGYHGGLSAEEMRIPLMLA